MGERAILPLVLSTLRQGLCPHSYAPSLQPASSLATAASISCSLVCLLALLAALAATTYGSVSFLITRATAEADSSSVQGPQQRQQQSIQAPSSTHQRTQVTVSTLLTSDSSTVDATGTAGRPALPTADHSPLMADDPIRATPAGYLHLPDTLNVSRWAPLVLTTCPESTTLQAAQSIGTAPCIARAYNRVAAGQGSPTRITHAEELIFPDFRLRQVCGIRAAACFSRNTICTPLAQP